jgi:transcriptional regulator with XRE-family HTH domain
MVTQVELIGARVRLLREAQRIEAGDLASRAKMSRAAVYRIESGERPNASAVTVGRLAQALGTSADYLIGLTDDPSPRVTRLDPQDPRLNARLRSFEARFARLDPDDQASVLDVIFALLQFRSGVDRQDDDEGTDEEAEPEQPEQDEMAERSGAA